jgi:hypothetical protein
MNFLNGSDHVLDCTLWDALSAQFLDFYNKNCDYPIVLILKHARVKEPQGFYQSQTYYQHNLKY